MVATTYNKYHNKKIIIDGHKFDSKKEANYYNQLKLLQRAGLIRDLELQKTFILQPSFKLNNITRRQIVYKADFTYFSNEDNKIHVIDVKGSKNIITEEFKIKKKLFEYKYGIEIEIII